MKTKSLNYGLFSMFLLTVFTSFTFLSPKMKVLDEYSSSGSFEGIISFIKKAGNKESKYNYIVKGNQARIEELDKDGDISGIMLLDTDKNTIAALNLLRKMYMSVPIGKRANSPNLELSKNETTQTHQGYKCKEWVATSKDQDRVITYPQ